MHALHHLYEIIGPYFLFIPSILTLLLTFYRFNVIPDTFQSLLELFTDFFHQQFSEFFLVEENYNRWIPFFMTFFFYILIHNLMGLIPGLHPYTSDLNITASLAILVFFITIATSIREHGFSNFIKHIVPSGIPLIIRILMFPIEVISKLATPFSLAVRLFANMAAGHMIIMTLLYLTKIFTSKLILPLDIIVVAIMLCFEIMVSFIQAYVFTYLSILFFTDTMYHHNHAMLCTFKKIKTG